MTSKMATCAVVGASGYVGGRLVEHLVARGTTVMALGRRIDRIPDTGIRRAVDIADTAATAAALSGVDTAYYLVHSMADGDDFAAQDRMLAESFSKAAAQAGVRRIVYLGALGRGELSEHLRSRQETGRALGSAGVEVVELRAAIVVGAGSISFEMLRYLTERLPVMVCPRWITTRIQPIAERDLLRYLEQASRVPPGIYEIGGPEATTYRDMMATYAVVRGLRKRMILNVPVLTPTLSAHWVDLVTPVDPRVSHALIKSLTSEVVVEDPVPTATAFDVDPMGVAAAIGAALEEQAGRVAPTLMGLADGLGDGIYAMRSEAELNQAEVSRAKDCLERCGGDLRWYGLPWAWRARLLIGRPFGERLYLQRPPEVVLGADVDWWQVEVKSADTLVLGTKRWFCGEAWLGYRITDPPHSRMEQVGALRPKGLLGVAYWRALWPVHRVVFRAMCRRRAGQARVRSGRPTPRT